MDDDRKRERIACLNDAFRRTFQSGAVYMTRGVAAMSLSDQFAVQAKVRSFNEFTPDNDPYGEHDFGAFTHGGDKCFWKIDYYDADDPNLGSEDPADPDRTRRVLTMMLANEY